MHNVNLAEFEQTIDKAHNDRGALRQPVEQVTRSPAVEAHGWAPWR
ncbi:MAG: hypothetical protein M3408_01205 [Actinomycetota bacterium]|jgi:hypothetical protein|nr:hypothetical protein [Actinomycetota bacterium]